MSLTTVNDEDLITRFRKLKESAVEDMEERGTDDIQPLIEVWRDGEPILFIMCPNVDRDEGLDAAYYSIRGLAADRIVMMLDAHVTKNMTNPKTGEPWGPGEMQAACDDDGACDIGLITDCLVVNDVSRDGNFTMHTLPYHVNKDAKEVHWQQEGEHERTMKEDDESKLEGLIPSVLRDAFSKPTFFEEYTKEVGLSPEEEGLTKVEAQAMQDSVTVFRMLAMGLAIVFTSSNQEWMELLKEGVEKLAEHTGTDAQFFNPDDLKDEDE